MHSTSSHKHRVCAFNSHPNLSQVNNLQDWECLQEYEPSQWHPSCFLFSFWNHVQVTQVTRPVFFPNGLIPLGCQPQSWSQQFPWWGVNTRHSQMVLCFTSVRTDRRHLGSPYRRCNPHRSQHAWLFHRASTTCGVSDWAFYTGVNLHKFHSVMSWGSLCIALQLQWC